MQVSIISRTSKAKYMKKMEKKILVLEIVWNHPNMIYILTIVTTVVSSQDNLNSALYIIFIFASFSCLDTFDIYI